MEKCSVEFQIIDVETINCFLEALMVGWTPVVIRIASLACALAQAVHQGRNRKQYQGMMLPSKGQPFDIPLAQHQRPTSPHISLCSSDSTM